MKKIIVTVTAGGHFSRDMELPTDIPMRLVQKNIIDNLSLLYPSFPFFRREWTLVCERTGVSPDANGRAFRRTRRAPPEKPVYGTAIILF